MGLIEDVQLAMDIYTANDNILHKSIEKNAKELLKRWTKPCQMCGEIDYELVVTETKGTEVLAWVVCAHCGFGYVMYPLGVKTIGTEHSIDSDEVATKAHGFGKALKLARMRQRLNQKELAQKLGCDASFISRLEGSERLPSVETLRRLATVLGISIDQLISYLDVEESKADGK